MQAALRKAHKHAGDVLGWVVHVMHEGIAHTFADTAEWYRSVCATIDSAEDEAEEQAASHAAAQRARFNDALSGFVEALVEDEQWLALTNEASRPGPRRRPAA